MGLELGIEGDTTEAKAGAEAEATAGVGVGVGIGVCTCNRKGTCKRSGEEWGSV